MDLLSIVSNITPYALVALVTAVVFISCILLGYKFYKRRGGKQTVTKMQFTAYFLLTSWLIIVIGITMFSRPSMFQGWFNFRLFSGYVNAWNNWSLSEFQLIIFNMLMFMPLGFLLPLSSKRLQHFAPVLLVSFLVTVCLETVQMLTGKGIFELDDILHNTIGSTTGYFLSAAILSWIEQKKISAKALLRALVIPLVITIAFSCAAIVYQTKELGNLPIRSAIPQDTSKGSIRLNVDLPETASSVAMYRNGNIQNHAYGEKVLSLVKEQFSLKQIGNMRTEGYNLIYFLTDKSGSEYSMHYSLFDGSWSLGKSDYIEKTPNDEILRNQLQIIEKWLLESDLLPLDSVFSIQNKDTLRWEKETPIDIIDRNIDYYSGIIMVQIFEDAIVPQWIFYTMAENYYIRNVDIISPAKAFEEVKKGNFQLYNDLKEDYVLIVDGYDLTYVYDTKGYYRPAYQFIGTLDGEQWSCHIPAM